MSQFPSLKKTSYSSCGLQLSVTDNFCYYINSQCDKKYFDKNILDFLCDWMPFVACQRQYIESAVPYLTGTGLIAQAVSLSAWHSKETENADNGYKICSRVFVTVINRKWPKFILLFINSPLKSKNNQLLRMLPHLYPKLNLQAKKNYFSTTATVLYIFSCLVR